MKPKGFLHGMFAVLLGTNFLLANTHVFAEGRTALVIGNQNYQEAPLRNAVNDAADMAVTLRRLGFEVLHLRDADLRQMEDAVRTFSLRLRNNETGLFFYAGHGVQAEGANYLVPVRAEIRGIPDLRYKAMDVAFLLDSMESAGNKLNIILLDACRNNPFRGLRGAGNGLLNMSGPAGSIIAFATAPNSTAADGTGRNGIYTKHILDHIELPGITIEEMLKRVRIGVTQETQGRQTPWENSSLSKEFCFAGCTPSASADTAPAAEIERIRRENDRRMQALRDERDKLLRDSERAAPPPDGTQSGADKKKEYSPLIVNP